LKIEGHPNHESTRITTDSNLSPRHIAGENSWKQNRPELRNASQTDDQPRARLFNRKPSSSRGLFQGGDVDLVHFHRRFHDAIRLPGIGIGQHIAEKDRVDLPRENEFVFEPAAVPGRSSAESFSKK